MTLANHLFYLYFIIMWTLYHPLIHGNDRKRVSYIHLLMLSYFSRLYMFVEYHFYLAKRKWGCKYNSKGHTYDSV